MQKTEPHTEPHVGPQVKRFTVEEFHIMFEAGIFGNTDHARVELIGGEVYEMAPVGSNHAACVKRLNALFKRIGGEFVIGVQDPIRLEDSSEPEPDISLLKPRDDFYATAHPRPEDVLLAIEVSDTTLAFDVNVKLPAYARAGISEVWIVDLNSDIINVHTNPKPDGYRNTLRARKNETFTSGVVSGELRASDVLG